MCWSWAVVDLSRGLPPDSFSKRSSARRSDRHRSRLPSNLQRGPMYLRMLGPEATGSAPHGLSWTALQAVGSLPGEGSICRVALRRASRRCLQHPPNHRRALVIWPLAAPHFHSHRPVCAHRAHASGNSAEPCVHAQDMLRIHVRASVCDPRLCADPS